MSQSVRRDGHTRGTRGSSARAYGGPSAARMKLPDRDARWEEAVLCNS